MPPHSPRESLKTGILEIQASQKRVQASVSALGQFSTDYVLDRGSTTHTDLKKILQYRLQTCRHFFEQHCAAQETAFATDMQDDLADSQALANMQDDLHEAIWYAWRVKTILLQCLEQETITQDDILYVSCKRLKSALHETDNAEIQPNPAWQRTSSARLAYMKICVDAFDEAHTKHVLIHNEMRPDAPTPYPKERERGQAALFGTECLDVQMVHKMCGQLADFKHVQRLLSRYFFRFVLQQINIFQIAVLVRIDMHIEEYESNVLTGDAAARADVDGRSYREMLAAHCACRVRFERVRTDSRRLMHGIAAIDGQTVPLTTFGAALEVLTRFQTLRNELGSITRRWDDMMQDTAAHPHRPDSPDQHGNSYTHDDY